MGWKQVCELKSTLRPSAAISSALNAWRSSGAYSEVSVKPKRSRMRASRRSFGSGLSG